jgi:lambda repressor-like predicted transcriptional regulator
LLSWLSGNASLSQRRNGDEGMSEETSLERRFAHLLGAAGLEMRLAAAFEQEHFNRTARRWFTGEVETPAYAPIIAELLEHCPRAKWPKRWKDAATMEFKPRRPRERVADSMGEPSVSSGKRGK